MSVVFGFRGRALVSFIGALKGVVSKLIGDNSYISWGRMQSNPLQFKSIYELKINCINCDPMRLDVMRSKFCN